MTRSVGGTSLMLIGAMSWLPLTGCSSKPPPRREDTAAINLRKIVQGYDLAEDRLHRGPRDEEELKRYLVQTDMTINPDEVMRSPRDGQPYVVIYGARLDPYGRDILAYEQEGLDGGRYVITLSRDVKLLTATEFAHANFAKGHKPAKTNETKH
jgi:hypothetical protein